MRNNKKLNWSAGAVVATAAIWLGLFLFPSPPGIDKRLHEAVGESLATEAIKLSDASARYIVLARDTVEFKVPATDAQLAGLQRALKTAGRTPAIVRIFKTDPLRVIEVPPGDFLELLRQAKENDVFISLLGPPNLVEAHLAKLGPGKRPKVIALCSGNLPHRVDLKRLFAHQVLHTAVISRPDAPAKVEQGDGKAAFAKMFHVITPANLTELDTLTAVTARD